MRPAALAALPGLLLLWACAAPAPPDLMLSRAELVALVSDHTLHLDAEDDASFGMLAYFGPDGAGWFDDRAVAGTPPSPGDIAKILEWRATDRSGICAWTTPRLGQIPFWAPPEYHCIQILRPAGRPDQLDGVVLRGNGTVRTPLQLRAGNDFPVRQTALFTEQLRVLSGGQVPVWQIPSVPPALRTGSAASGLHEAAP